jgi:hypothetical protein
MDAGNFGRRDAVMKALVVYESMFGNTEHVARAIARGLSKSADVTVYNVGDEPQAVSDGSDVIVAGGPTHAFSMSRPSTRVDAVKQGASSDRSTIVGLREWVDGLRPGHRGQVVATFDTRVAKVRHLPGSAAKSAARILRRRGYPAVSSKSFYVTDTTGPLLPGEIERAEAWGQMLAAHEPA